METEQLFIDNTLSVFNLYKKGAENAIAQLGQEQLFIAPALGSNSIAVIVKHLCGNMLSRWTDFFTTDGEKEWRNRDAEFEADDIKTKAELMAKWEQGWACMFNVLNSITPADLNRTVYIRKEEYTVLKAMQRQLAHYSYHVGQIIYVAKMLKGEEWKSLSIPKGQSKAFNEKMFSKK